MIKLRVLTMKKIRLIRVEFPPLNSDVYPHLLDSYNQESQWSCSHCTNCRSFWAKTIQASSQLSNFLLPAEENTSLAGSTPPHMQTAHQLTQQWEGLPEVSSHWNL